MIRIKDADETNSEFKETSPYFTKASIAGFITNKYAREYNTSIFAFTGAVININKRIEDEINKENERH